MQLKAFVILLVGLSISACANGPEVTVCVSNPEENVAECSTPDDQEFSLPYTETNNYIMISPEDFEKLIEYYKRQCNG